MLLKDIIKILPNGFHDAELHEYRHIFKSNSVELIMDVWIGDIDSGNEEDRERCKSAVLTLRDLIFWIAEVPADLANNLNGSVSIDIGEVETLNIKPKIALPSTPMDCPSYWLFNSPFNSFCYFSSRSAQLDWITNGDERS